MQETRQKPYKYKLAISNQQPAISHGVGPMPMAHS